MSNCGGACGGGCCGPSWTIVSRAPPGYGLPSPIPMLGIADPEAFSLRGIENVRAPGGRTAESPCWARVFCNSGDVDAWNQSSDAKMAEVITGWNSVFTRKRAAAEALRKQVEAYEEAHKHMPTSSMLQVFGAGGAEKDVTKLVLHVTQGEGLREALSSALVAAGGAPLVTGPVLPGPGGGELLGIPWWAFVLAGGAYIYSQERQRR